MNQVKLIDKIICASFYAAIFIDLLTWVPLVWIIIASLRKQYLPDFIKYHCYQAILFNMITSFFPQLLRLLIKFITSLLDLFSIFANTISLLNTFTNWFVGVYFVFIQLVAVYAIIWTLRGRYTYVPPLSQAVNLLLR